MVDAGQALKRRRRAPRAQRLDDDIGERDGHRRIGVAGWCFLLGTVVFSGSLYAMTLGGPRWLGAITPIGGVLFLVGWAALAAHRPGPVAKAGVAHEN